MTTNANTNNASLLAQEGTPNAPAAGTPGTEPTGGGVPETPKAPVAEPTAPETPAPPEPPKEPSKEGKPNEAKAEPSYSFKLPDGMEADKELMEGQFVPLVKELKLPGETAQKFVDLYAKSREAEMTRLKQQLADEERSLREATQADKEIGGEALSANLVIARKSLSQFGTPKLLARIEALGLGNDPEFIRFCYRVGKGVGEDSVAGTTHPSAGNGVPSEEAILRQRYPSMFENK
jgi:hypothetical protein